MFAKRKFPKKSAREIEDSQERFLFNRENDFKYQQLITDFFENEGQAFKPVVEEMDQKLTLQKNFSELFEDRKMQLIPSFFSLVQKLSAENRNFSVIFRTFGTDTELVIQEFNLFCRGAHPLYNGENGTYKFESKSLEVQDVGYFTRVSETQSYLVMGSLLRHSRHTPPQATDSVKVFEDTTSILNALLTSGSLAINDDYEFWDFNKRLTEYGKLLLVDPGDKETVQIFFDDNIGESFGKAIDVRNVHTGEPIAFGESINKYLWRVNPYLATVEEDYFYNAVLVCESNQCAS